MQTLVIHPQDASTDFLKPIYQNLNCKVITGNCTKADVYEQVALHGRIIMLGHGSPSGLFAVGQFINERWDSYIVDESFADLLLKKNNNVYIWCHANRFVEKHQLSGFYTGMFISEVHEALMFDIKTEEELVKQSNDLFAGLVGKVIEKQAVHIHKHIMQEYTLPGSPVAEFNYERMYWK
jgi:hypothetical protein